LHVPQESDGGTVPQVYDVPSAQDADGLSEDFVAMVSHELRAPLSPIKGWATTLLRFGDDMEPEERRAALQSILRQARRIERLITSLLEVSQIAHGKREAVQSEACVEDVLRRVIDDFEAMFPDRRIEVRHEHDVRVRGNELWTEQILTNLVSNAVKYSPETEPVKICVARREGRVAITVVDRGCGIPPDELERVFERFHRLPETTTQSGAGLGLYIARQLAEEMGGHIEVDSSPGRGSTFTLDLPAAARIVDVR